MSNQLNPNGIRLWGSALRPLANASLSPPMQPGAYNVHRLQGQNRRHAVHGIAPGLSGGRRPASSVLPFGAPIAQSSQAKALPPDLYNKGRLTGSNKKVAYIGLGPRTRKTASAIMKSGEVTKDSLQAKAESAKKPIDVNELVSGLKAALDVADSEEQRDSINHQLATLRPFVLLAKKRELTDEEQNIVDGIGRALLAQAEEQIGAEVGA